MVSCSVATGAVAVQDQAKTANSAKSNAGPVVEDWNPKTGSINSIIELQGYRLYPDSFNKTKIFFIQNGLELPARTGGGTSITNNDHHGAQTVQVIVPEEVVPGPAQIVAELNGHRSVPATVTITEWKLPVVKRISPTRGAPGTFVYIECDGFHVDDEIEITDAEGKEVRFDSGGGSNGTGFGVRSDMPEGPITIRIGNKKYGKGQYTEPFTFVVTNDPLPPELITSFMKSVAPGQWVDLQVANDGPFRHAERIEVAFKQAGRQIIVAAPKPSPRRVQAPSALSAGEAELQVRTWRDGRPSEWSEPVIYKLADKPLSPSVAAIRLSQDTWVHLWPGPDRPQSFTMKPDDEFVLSGLWPVAGASELRVSLVRPGEVITLTPAKLNENTDFFSEVRVRLPKSLAEGEWRMIVSSPAEGTQDELPIVIRIVRKESSAVQ